MGGILEQHQPPVYPSSLCPEKSRALNSTASCVSSSRLQITLNSKTFAWIWTLHGFAEIWSKAAYMPQSAAMCRYDSTLHHALAVTLSSGEPRKQENFGIQPPSARAACLLLAVFQEVADNFLRLVRGLEVTSDWVDPLIKELHFSLNMLNYTLNKKPEQTQEPLQGVLFYGHCHPCKRVRVSTQTSKVGLFRIMFYHPKWTFTEQGEPWIAPRHWPCEEPHSMITQDPAFMEHIRTQIQSGMDMWTELSLEGKAFQIHTKKMGFGA